MIALKFSAWHECDFDEYREQCEIYGYNSESSPHYIRFMLDNGANFRFLKYEKQNKTLGAVCLDNGWLANDYKNPASTINTLHIPRYSIFVPFHSSVRCIAPFRTKSLSVLSSPFMNASYNLFSRRKVGLAKQISAFSSKSKSSRNRELRRFFQDGGQLKKVSDFDAGSLFTIYESLYYKRRGKNVSDRQLNLDFHKQFAGNFTGNVLVMNDEPVCIQLLLTTHSRAGYFVDFINIGYDPSIKKHSLGTMVMWANLLEENEKARILNMPLYFSFGAMSGEYKKRWCEPVSAGRILSV